MEDGEILVPTTKENESVTVSQTRGSQRFKDKLFRFRLANTKIHLCLHGPCTKQGDLG